MKRVEEVAGTEEKEEDNSGRRMRQNRRSTVRSFRWKLRKIRTRNKWRRKEEIDEEQEEK